MGPLVEDHGRGPAGPVDQAPADEDALPLGVVG